MTEIYIKYPEFCEAPVPIKVAAKVLGMSENTIREKMEDRTLDIGIVTRRQASRTCYISPKKFWELTGYIWDEDHCKSYKNSTQENQ